MIIVENLSKSFGGQLLFKNIDIKINPRERVGLVGRNGHGKTTFFRLITGEEEPDEGRIIIPKHYRIGSVDQQLHFTKKSVLEEGMTALGPDEHDHLWKVEKILSGLGFSNKEMQQHPSEFSGGYQVRLNLAKILVSRPDLILLDEPTNYLDIESIRWIVRFLAGWPRELILITHDRSFMDKVVTHTIAIHRKRFRKVAGNTEKLYNQLAQEEDVYEKTRINDERRQKRIELFVNRFRAKARLANLVQSRLKTLKKIGSAEKIEKLKTLDFAFQCKPFHRKYVLKAENISFSYNSETPVIENFSLTVKARDRICIIGKNGKGKTTLIKLLSEKLKPQKGEIIFAPNLAKGVYEQTNIKSLIDTRTVEEEILYAGGSSDRQKARNICGAMMFEGDAALKLIEVLSGGEKSRVMLGKILARPVNLLLLDEPGNHLDMESCDSLIAALTSFEGSVVMVTHNEMFLRAIANRLIIFQNENLSVFEGTYEEFLEKDGWKDDNAELSSVSKDNDNSFHTKLNKKEIRRKRSAIIAKRAETVRPIKQKISRVEDDIESCEKRLDKLNAELLEASQAQDGQLVGKISQSIHGCRLTIDDLFDKLEAYTYDLDEKNSIFEEELRQLD